MELLEDSLSDSKLYLVNYTKSLCEVVSLGAPTGDKATVGVGNSDLMLMHNLDRNMIREMSIEDFKTEVNMTVKRINQSISSNLSCAKTLSLQKIEKIVTLIRKVRLSDAAQPRLESKFL